MAGAAIGITFLVTIVIIAAVLAVLVFLTKHVAVTRPQACAMCMGDAYPPTADPGNVTSYQISYTTANNDVDPKIPSEWSAASLTPTDCRICGSPTTDNNYYVNYNATTGLWSLGSAPVTFDPTKVSVSGNAYLYDSKPTCVRYGAPSDGPCDPLVDQYHCAGGLADPADPTSYIYGTATQQYNALYNAFSGAEGKYPGTTC